MEIPKNLKDEIWKYCFSNDITDIDGFMLKLLRQGFTTEKFGSTPFKQEEKIKEVEKIVEVVKEVEVIKEVPITNDEEIKKLADKLNNVEVENAELTTTLETLKGELDKVQEELNLERNKPKKENDIYGEQKKGFYGSNTRDIYGNE